MKSHIINTLKLCRHSGIVNHSITHFITLIKKELRISVQSYSFFHQMVVLKVALSAFKNICVICFIELPLKMMENAFYFILKTHFIIKLFKSLFIFKFLFMKKKRFD